MIGPADGFGIYIDDVFLMEMIPISPVNVTINSTTGNTTNSTVNATTINTNSSSNTTNATNGTVTPNTTNGTITPNSTNGTLSGNATFDLTMPDNYSIPTYLKVMLQYSYKSTLSELLNRYPGSRLFFMFVMNFNINLDRLQFYFYHNQNFTHYSLLLI